MSTKGKNVCGCCPKEIPEGYVFCSETCENKFLYGTAYDVKHLISHIPLAESVKGELCPVCEKRERVPGIGTCLNSECRECWTIAWSSN